MKLPASGWLLLILSLCISTFGFYTVFSTIIGFLFFLTGFLTIFYVYGTTLEPIRFDTEPLDNPLKPNKHNYGGLSKVVQYVKDMQNPKPKKTDKRITGSDVIDNSLHEIFGYIIRDYIDPWYNLITDDKEFVDEGVRRSAQQLAINISNRVKEIDWLPYLTTRLVDDVATHLRLYKQARAKMKLLEKPKSPRGSPMRNDNKLSPKRSHKRNKSETDATWYFGAKGTEKRPSDSSIPLTTLEDFFFDMECKMENNLICRDIVCMDTKKESEFLAELTEILLYLLLPDDDFNCKPVCFLLRELFTNCVFQPLFTLISDPDYINQAIIWLCFREAVLPSDIFLYTLRITDNCDELKYTKEIVTREIQQLRSKDLGREDDASIKQQLSSLYYLNKLIDNRIEKLQDNDTISLWNQQDFTRLLGDTKPMKLPLETILKNNVALSYFIDYVTSNGHQLYLFFYLNVEGWKITTEQQLSNVECNRMKGINEDVNSVYEKIRETAFNIYEQYLSEKSLHKLIIHPTLVQTLFFRIKNLTDQPSELWFDDIQKVIYDKMQNEDDFLPSFQRSSSYLKLLAEFDLLGHTNADEDDLSVNSLENVELNTQCDTQNNKMPNTSETTNTITITAANCGTSVGAIVNAAAATVAASIATCPITSPSTTTTTPQTPFNSSDLLPEKDYLTITRSESMQKMAKHARSYSDITDIAAISKSKMETSTTTTQKNDLLQSNSATTTTTKESLNIQEEDLSKLKVGNFTLSVQIIEAGVMSDKGKTFGIYAIQVTKSYDTKYTEQWHIYRRYSDFHDLYTKIKDKFVDLSKIPFPGKKTFHNMDRSVLERRMRMLNNYMQEICKRVVVDSHVGLRPLLLTFVEQGEYDRATTGGHISQTIDTLKSGIKSIKNMPENLINTVDEVVGGLSKVFHSKSDREPIEAASKVGAVLDIETDDNIPLRIMLLLMDEVFDLKSRNQWLRRRIVTILRQIIRTMFGDIVNKKIIDFVSFITSPKNVAHYLHTFKQSFWPNGIKAEKKPSRSEGVRSRTRVAAKVVLLNTLSDELKHIIGSETTRRGLLTVFDMFQRPILNRRLLYVLVEGILCTLFTDKNMTEIFQKLHSNSRRIPDQKTRFNQYR